MEYRPFGRTGLTVSEIGLGCMMFGWRADANEVGRILSTAVDVGINILDTSVSYGRGASEELVGATLSRMGARRDFLLATKFGQASEASPARNGVGNSRLNLLRQCELSLGRLKVDYLDLLQIHWPSADIPIEETLRGLDQLVRDGKVRYVGVSNFLGGQLIESLWCSDRRNFSPVSSMQVRYNILDRRAEQELFYAADRFGLGVITYSPLAEGMLAGHYRDGKEFPPERRFGMARNRADLQRRFTPDVRTVLEVMQQAASQREVSMSALALSWVLRNNRISTVLSGPSRAEQLLELTKVGATIIDDDLIATIDRCVPPGQSRLVD